MFVSKRFPALAMILGVLIAASPLRAETSIAVLNVARIFEAYEMTRDLEALFEQARREAADEAEQRRNSMEQMRRALAAFDPDSDDYARREQELTRTEIEFQVWTKAAERRLKSDHLRWMKKIYRNTQDVIGEIAEERNFELVLTYDELTDEVPDSVALRQQILLQKVIYHDKRVDITDETLRRLNEAYRKSGGIRTLDSAATTGQSESTGPRTGAEPPPADQRDKP